MSDSVLGGLGSSPSLHASAGDDDDVDSFLRAIAAAPAVPLSSADDEGLGLQPGDPITERYEVEHLLGRGGMGEVYRARDTRLDRPVAIKLHLAEPRPGGLDRLLREARALAQLGHPHVVEVFDVGTFEQRLYIAMEYVSGGDLRRWLAASPRTWPQIRERFVQAGRGLAAAHRAGLVHRDFKPDNVLVGDDGRARVADFGLVREGAELRTLPSGPSAEPSVRSGTRTGTVAGTLAYMAPEQWRGEPIDARADQFAFCVALHEAVALERPDLSYSMEPGTSWSPPGAIEPVVPDVPASARAAILRGLQPDPDDRFPDMDALLRQLAPERPRRWLGWSAAALGLCGIMGAAAWWSTPSESRCDDGRGELTETWNDTRRTRVRESLAAIGVNAEVIAGVDTSLETTASAWLEHRARVCTLTQEPEAGPRLDRRIDCLRRHRIGLAAAIEILEQAEPDLAERVTTLVPGPSTLARCEDDEALAAAIPPPDDPTVALEVAAIRDELARWPALDAAGRYDEAAERFAPVVDRARATTYAPVIGTALFIYGEAVLNLGRAAEAEPLLSEAYMVARSSGDDFIAYQSAATLVRVVGFQLDRPEDALRWGKHAKVLLPQIPEGRRERGMVFDALSSIHRHLGDLESAEAMQRRAVEESRKAEDGGWEHGGTMMGLAGIIADRGRFDEARPLAERALQIMLERRGPDHPSTGVAHSKLAPILEAQGHTDDAIEHRRKALEIFERAYPQGHPRIGAAANNYGDALMEAGRVNEALPHIERAVEIFGTLAPGSRRHMFVTKVLANALEQAGRVDDAIERYRQVLRTQHDPVLRAQTLSDLGDTLRSEGRMAEAIERFEEAISGLEEAHGDAHPELALPRSNLGYSLLMEGRFDDAVEQFEAAARAHAQQAEDDPERLHALMGQGIAELGRGRVDVAVTILERAVGLGRSAGADPNEVALARFALARALRTKGGADAKANELEALAAEYEEERAELDGLLSGAADRDR